MVVIAVTGAVVLPGLWRGLRHEAVRETGEQVMAFLRDKQKEAMHTGRAATVRIDDDKGALAHEGGRSLTLPEGFKIVSKHPEIVFYGDGTALEGDIEIRSVQGRSVRIVVDPFSGLATKGREK